MPAVFRAIRNYVQNQECILAGLVLAFLAFAIPLQHYITLARLQHYGIALYIWALSFMVQVGWSWKRLRPWGRATYALTGSYLASFASVIHSNPWLDPTISLQTSLQELERIQYTFVFAGAGLILGAVWIAWCVDEMSQSRQRGTDSPDGAGQQAGGANGAATDDVPPGRTRPEDNGIPAGAAPSPLGASDFIDGKEQASAPASTACSVQDAPYAEADGKLSAGDSAAARAGKSSAQPHSGNGRSRGDNEVTAKRSGALGTQPGEDGE